MMTPMKHHPVTPAAKSGFGFEEIMGDPDYTRFMDWYGQFSLLASGGQATAAAATAQMAHAQPVEPTELLTAA
jgi:hypothetical protein